VNDTPLLVMRTQNLNVIWTRRQVVNLKVAATNFKLNLDMQIRNLQPDNLSPVQMAWVNTVTDRLGNSNMLTNVIPAKQYKLRVTNDELHRDCAASACLGSKLGIPNLNPVCIPHIGTRLVRRASEEEEKYDDDADSDRTRRGDTVDAFGFTVTVSARVLVQH
jgi:hypothetical protein